MAEETTTEKVVEAVGGATVAAAVAVKVTTKEMWRKRLRGWRTVLYGASVSFLTVADMVSGQVDLKDVAHKIFPGYEIEGVILFCTLMMVLLRVLTTTGIFKSEPDPPTQEVK